MPFIYTAPTVVSHQSRIDVQHSPGFIAGPLIYPSTIFASHPNTQSNNAVVTPVLTTNTVFAPIALSFFHNLPLARALQHPVTIEKAQDTAIVQDEATNDGRSILKSSAREVVQVPVTKGIETENVAISALPCDNDRSSNPQVLNKNLIVFKDDST